MAGIEFRHSGVAFRYVGPDTRHRHSRPSLLMDHHGVRRATVLGPPGRFLVLGGDVPLTGHGGVSPLIEFKDPGRNLVADPVGLAFACINSNFHRYSWNRSRHDRRKRVLVRSWGSEAHSGQARCACLSTNAADSCTSARTTAAAPSRVPHAPRPASDVDQRTRSGTSFSRAWSSLSRASEAAIALVPLKHAPHWCAFSRSK